MSINQMPDILMQEIFTSPVGLPVISVKDFTSLCHNYSILGYFIPKLNLFRQTKHKISFWMITLIHKNRTKDICRFGVILF